MLLELSVGGASLNDADEAVPEEVREEIISLFEEEV